MKHKKIKVNSVKSSDFYIDKQKLKDEIKIFQKTGNITEELGNMLMNIAKRYATKSCFNGYTFKDDFIADAVARMIEQLHKIDLNHKNCNPFSYLTQMCYWKFVSKINDEKRQSNAKNALISQYIKQIENSENIKIKYSVNIEEGNCD